MVDVTLSTGGAWIRGGAMQRSIGSGETVTGPATARGVRPRSRCVGSPAGLVLAFCALLLAFPASASGGWIVREVTIPAYRARVDDMNSRLVALTAGQAGSGGIYLYEFSTGRQHRVTSNSYDDAQACLAESGVYWSGRDGTDRDIFYAPFGAATPVKITDDDRDDSCPKAAGDWVFWVHDDGHDTEIMARNTLSGSLKTLTDNAHDDGDLGILSFDGRYAAWHRWYADALDRDVLVCDTLDETLPVVRLYDDTAELGFCHAAGGRVVMMRRWQNGGQDYSDIWSYDPAALPGQRWVQLSTPNPPSYFSTALLGDVGDGRHTIYLQDTDEGIVVRLVDHETRISVTLSPSASNDNGQYQDGIAIWESGAAEGRHLFAYDVATAATVQLTDAPGLSNRWPCTAGGRVCWTEPGADGTTRLFIAELVGTGLVFEDVPAGHRYGEAIEGLFRQGVVSGTREEGGLRWFGPDDRVMRAQFAKMVCGTLRMEVDPKGMSPFTDLGTDDPSTLYPHQYVATAYQWGITTGTSAANFSPWEPVARAQVVTMLVRGAQAYWPGHLIQPPSSFSGSTLGRFDQTHEWSMWVAEYNGLMEGLQGFGVSWDPWAEATRAEVAQMMWNLLLQ